MAVSRPGQRDGEAEERYPDVTSHQIQSCPDEFCAGVILKTAPELTSLNRRVPEVHLARRCTAGRWNIDELGPRMSYNRLHLQARNGRV